jgi:hypothetical protein
MPQLVNAAWRMAAFAVEAVEQEVALRRRATSASGTI